MTLRTHIATLLHRLADRVQPEPSHTNEGMPDNGNDTTGFLRYNERGYVYTITPTDKPTEHGTGGHKITGSGG